jgi:hypothetical protein
MAFGRRPQGRQSPRLLACAKLGSVRPRFPDSGQPRLRLITDVPMVRRTAANSRSRKSLLSRSEHLLCCPFPCLASGVGLGRTRCWSSSKPAAKTKCPDSTVGEFGPFVGASARGGPESAQYEPDTPPTRPDRARRDPALPSELSAEPLL